MSKIKISLTDFVDFVSKSGTTKLTKVKQIKKRPTYHPAFDFWKIMRDEIIEFHKESKDDKHCFDEILPKLTDKKKIGRYPDIIVGYKKFLGKKTINYFKVHKSTWTNNDLEVRINPELGLTINNKKYIVKLYFKSEGLSKAKVESILFLLKETYSVKISQGIDVAILDIQKNKLIISKSVKNIMPLLIGEANSFETIWKNL